MNDDVESPGNICFIKCKELGYNGTAFMRSEPKKIIFLCEEYFESGIKYGEYNELVNIVTHEMVHWIDVNRDFDFSNQNELFCSELRANLLSGQCMDNYEGKNHLLDHLLNRSKPCAIDKANRTSISLTIFIQYLYLPIESNDVQF